MQNTILGIETSCDETAVAVYGDVKGLQAHRIFSQVALHAKYGGVVPELASRDHIRKLLPMIEGAPAGCRYRARGVICRGVYRRARADRRIAGRGDYGRRPGHGLGYSVDSGTSYGGASSGFIIGRRCPGISVSCPAGFRWAYDARRCARIWSLPHSRSDPDDAAGEAFDKTAKLLGLPYPGGPELSALAEHGQGERFELPRPMLKRPGLDFSFSGLKTAVMLKVRALENAGTLTDSARADLADAFQQAVVDTLVAKSLRAIKQTAYRRLVVAGGVGANRLLRQRLKEAMAAKGGCVYYPRTEFCTDNGAMVAFAGLLRFQAGAATSSASPRLTVEARARWNLQEI